MAYDTKPLAEVKLVYHHKIFCGIHLRAISSDVLINLKPNIYLKVTLLKSFQHFSGADELRDETLLPLMYA